MRNPRAGLVVALLLSGCALPTADNPADPKNQPIAALVVTDRTLADGSCADPASLETFPSILSAARSRCIALDARGSHRLGGDASGLSFAFEMNGVALPGATTA